MTGPPRVHFRGLRVGRKITIDRGREFQLPSREDYVRYLIEKQHIRSEAELIQDPELVLHVQRHWHRTGQSGCRFAQVLSHNPDDGWGTVVIAGEEGRPLPELAWGGVDAALSSAIANPHVLVLSFIFPSIASAKGLSHLLSNLAKLDRWSVSRIDDAYGNEGTEVVNIQARLRITDDGVSSWVLGFGPFDFLPNTRQSPFTELAAMLRRKTFPLRHPSLNTDPMTAHLADIRAERISDANFLAMYDSTVKWKLQMLAGHQDRRARARVTFSIPKEFAEGI